MSAELVALRSTASGHSSSLSMVKRMLSRPRAVSAGNPRESLLKEHDEYHRMSLPSWLRVPLRTAIIVSLFFQVVTVIFLAVSPEDRQVDKHAGIWVIIPCAVLQVCQFFLLILGTYLSVRSVWHLDFQNAWILYITKILMFAGFYMLTYVSFNHAFTHTSALRKYNEFGNDRELIEMYMVFVYFSVSTQSLVGFGDISPIHPTSQLLAAAQMALGTFYSVFILSQTMTRFEKPKKLSGGQKKHGCMHRITRIRLLRKIRRKVRDYLFLFTFFWQLTNVLILYFAVDNIFEAKDRPMLFISLVFEAIQVLIILVTSLKFVRKTYKVTIRFLISSYGAIILTFGAIYTLIYIAYGGEHNGFVLPSHIYDIYSVTPGTPGALWPLLLEFFYFAITVQTTAGYGDVFPASIGARVAVSLQMLVSVLYAVIILGFGLSRIMEVKSFRAKLSSVLTTPSPGLTAVKPVLDVPSLHLTKPIQRSQSSYGTLTSPRSTHSRNLSSQHLPDAKLFPRFSVFDGVQPQNSASPQGSERKEAFLVQGPRDSSPRLSRSLLRPRSPSRPAVPSPLAVPYSPLPSSPPFAPTPNTAAAPTSANGASDHGHDSV